MYKFHCLLYDSSMTTVNVSEARNNLAAVIQTAQNEAVTVERRGEAQAVILSPAEYKRLVETSEEIDDIASFDEAMAEEGENIPWDQVKTDLGW